MNTQTITYQFNTTAALRLGFLPSLSSLSLVIVMLFVPMQHSAASIILWTVLFLYTAGVFVFLFFEHLKHARQTVLVAEGRSFILTVAGRRHAFHFNDIEEITEYSNNQFPWSAIVKWKIKTKEDELPVSSLVISRAVFEALFANRIQSHFSIFPLMKHE